MEKTDLYEKYPWTKAYEKLAQNLKTEYNGLSEEQKKEGDYSPIVKKVKAAFTAAHVDYFRDDWLFRVQALQDLRLSDKDSADLSKEQKKQVNDKINELKGDDKVKAQIAKKTDSDIDPFSIFGFFNVDKGPKRLDLARELMKQFDVDETIIRSFNYDDKTGAGIPVENYNHRIKNLDIETQEKNKRLWELFCAIIDKNLWDDKARGDLARQIQIIEKGQSKKGQEKIEKIRGFSSSRLYLFWVQPSKFLPLDSRSTAYLDFKNFDDQLVAANLKKDIKVYLDTCAAISRQEEDKRPFASFVDFSQSAFDFSDVNGTAARLLEKNHNLVLHGAPGTGKTFMAKRIAEKHMGAEIELVQFHPSYDYTDFVEGLRPKDDATGGNVGFELIDGKFKSFCLKALKSDKPHVFIIDEINRGDISKIFGELFFSIDPGYRGIQGAVLSQYSNMVKKPNEFDMVIQEIANKEGATEDVKKKVEAARKFCEKDSVYKINEFGHFFVPENVYIIGTMNDIDRSVESMDFAFRRRFAWLEVLPQAREVMLDEELAGKISDDDELLDTAKEWMNGLNKAIRENPNLGSAYQIGPAYFLKLAEYKDDKEPMDSLWEYHLEGLLRDYLRGTESDAQAEADKLDELHRAYDPSFKQKGKRGRKKAGAQNGDSDDDNDSGSES